MFFGGFQRLNNGCLHGCHNGRAAGFIGRAETWNVSPLAWRQKKGVRGAALRSMAETEGEAPHEQIPTVWRMSDRKP
jgi:hypothetical protein